MTKIETLHDQKALELLAAELRAGKLDYSAADVLAGNANLAEQAALRAIIAAHAAGMNEAAEIAATDFRSPAAKELGYEPDWHRAGQRIAEEIRNAAKGLSHED